MVGAWCQSGRKLHPNRRVSRRRSEITHRHPARIEPTTCAVDAIEPLVQPLVEAVADAAAQFLHDTGVAQVHKLRVAVRRLRGALEAFDRLLPPQELRVVQHRLRRLQHRLGTVRDWDVFAKGALWSTPLPLMSADRVKFAERCERQRQTAATRAVRAVARRRFRKTLTRIERLICAARKATGSPDPSTRLLATQLPFEQFADDILRRDWQAFEDQRALCSTGNLDRLHALRLRGKQLRDRIELFGRRNPLASSRRLLQSLQKLQEVLGERNDAAQAQRLFDRLQGDEAKPLQIDPPAASDVRRERARSTRALLAVRRAASAMGLSTKAARRNRLQTRRPHARIHTS